MGCRYFFSNLYILVIFYGKLVPGKPSALSFKAIVAGFRGKVALKNRTLGVPGRNLPLIHHGLGRVSFNSFGSFRILSGPQMGWKNWQESFHVRHTEVRLVSFFFPVERSQDHHF